MCSRTSARSWQNVPFWRQMTRSCRQKNVKPPLCHMPNGHWKRLNRPPKIRREPARSSISRGSVWRALPSRFATCARHCRLAQELTTTAPAWVDSWSILGAALYYNGEEKAALDAFRKARGLDPGKFGGWDFFAAMAHLKLGEKAEAQACYDRAASWMKQNPHSTMHERLQAEAAKVLNLRDPATPSRSGQDLHARVR